MRSFNMPTGRKFEERFWARNCHYKTGAVRRFNFVRKIALRIMALSAYYDFLANAYIILEAFG